jgi:hypothetical protein
MKMFVEVLALQRREVEGNVWKNGTLAGVKAMVSEVVLSNLHRRTAGGRERNALKNLGMYMPRQQLDT